MSANNSRRRPTTSIGHSTPEMILVQGENLADELMGEIDFGTMCFLLVTGRRPDAHEGRMFNAVLVALADHGLTPTALAARLTYTGAPDAIQGAIAAGILGAGSVFLGVLEDVGRMLRSVPSAEDLDEAGLRRAAADLVADYRARREHVPGLGHPTHKDGDPRTRKLSELARRNGPPGAHVRLLLAIQEEAASTSRIPLPLNAAGMCGAVLCDMGIPTEILRGVAVVSRAAGILGHIAEETRDPTGRFLWELAEREVEYVDPTRGRAHAGGPTATAARDTEGTATFSAFSRWYEAHEAGDLEGLSNALAEDAEIHSLFRDEPVHGRAAAIEHFRGVSGSFSNLRMELVREPVVSDDAVLAEVSFSGAFTGTLNWNGKRYAGSGQTFTVPGMAKIRVAGDRVCEVQTLFDRDDWLRQIDIAPARVA